MEELAFNLHFSYDPVSTRQLVCIKTLLFKVAMKMPIGSCWCEAVQYEYHTEPLHLVGNPIWYKRWLHFCSNPFTYVFISILIHACFPLP